MVQNSSPKYQPGPDDPLSYFVPSARPPTPAEALKHAKDYPFPKLLGQELPPMFRLAPWWGQNQLNRGACAFFGTGRVAMQERDRVGLGVFDYSEEAAYSDYNQVQGTPCQDLGAWPGTIVDRMIKIGLAYESDMPYMSTNLCDGPSADLRIKMATERPVAYTLCGDEASLKQAIYQNHRVTACFTLSNNFRTRKTGDFYVMDEPGNGVWGGHLMDYFGWDDDFPHPWGTGGYWCQNQWGQGDADVFVVPYAFHRLGGWQVNGFGFWHDAAYTLNGWNGRMNPDPAPPPDDGDQDGGTPTCGDAVRAAAEDYAERLTDDLNRARGHAKYVARLRLEGAQGAGSYISGRV